MTSILFTATSSFLGHELLLIFYNRKIEVPQQWIGSMMLGKLPGPVFGPKILFIDTFTRRTPTVWHCSEDQLIAQFRRFESWQLVYFREKFLGKIWSKPPNRDHLR